MFEAVFLDRDGVINCERADYVKRWEEFEFLPGALDAVAKLAGLDWPVIVVTNQSAIGRGILTAMDVDAIHTQLRHAVEDHGGRIDAFYICPHHPQVGCSCRKPRPGLLLQAADDYALDLSQCVFVGDSLTDREAAVSVGCESILVQTGREGELVADQAMNDPTVKTSPDLGAAVQEILSMAQECAGRRVANNHDESIQT